MRQKVMKSSNERKKVAVCFIAVVLILLFSAPVRTQVVGATLSGTVTDASGAAIPDARISIKNTSTGVTRDVTTDSSGFYTVPNLLPGSYGVTFSAQGFATVVESNLLLAVGDQRTLNRSMQVGQVTQRVEVTAAAATVQLASSTLSAEVNSTTVRELPLNGRDWTSLATLQPGVVPVRTQQSATSATAPRGPRGFGTDISDAGHRSNENNYRVNGISVLDYANGSPGSALGGALGVDAIQEFSVLTSNYSAEYGRTSGGVINAITKSGTNELHGDAYWFIREKSLDARNFFDIAIPPFHRNNFGASVGGPIQKDKTFFFFDYEGMRQDKSINFNDFVPSPAARAGNLCSIPNGKCAPTTITVNSLVAPFLPLYPLPNASLIGNGDVGVFNTAGLQHFTENYETARIDHRISEKDSLAGSWFLDKSTFSQPDALVDSLSGNTTFREMFSLEETRVFSPRLVNTARVGFNRAVGVANVPLEAFNPLAADTSLASIPGFHAAILQVPSLTQMNGALGDGSFNHQVFNSFQIYDDAFLTRGTHSLKFGFAWERMQLDPLSLTRRNGSFKFPSLQDFLLDQPTSVQFLSPGSSKEAGGRQSIFAGYVQDDWRAHSNFTLNLGLRYEPTTLPTEAHNQFQTVVDFYNGGPVPVQTLWKTNATVANFGPRVGFSWDPFRDGKTAVRGGFGIFDNLPILWLFGGSGSTASSYPFAVNIVQSGLAPGSFPTGIVTSTAIDVAKAQNRFTEQNPPRSYAINWNFNIQREITPSLTATVGYVGSHSVHQPDTPDDSDLVLPTLTSAGYLWPFPVGSGKEFNQQVGSLRALTWAGSGSYAALQAQVTKKMSHGLQAQASYSWSKCIDDGSAGQFGDLFTNGPTSLPWYDKSSRLGLCDYNVPQNLVVNYVWDIPKPTFGGTAGSYVLSGWEVTGIFTAAGGQPFTPLIAGDPQGMKGDPNAYPDRLAGCNPINPNYRSIIEGGSYLNTNCFIPPIAPASFAAVCQPAAASVAAVIPNTCMNLQGNSGRGQITGPGVTNLDFSLIKNTYVRRISESFNVQFRAEFFNILNHANFQLPADNLFALNQDGTPVSGAGALDSTSTDSREIQLALKLIW